MVVEESVGILLLWWRPDNIPGLGGYLKSLRKWILEYRKGTLQLKMRSLGCRELEICTILTSVSTLKEKVTWLGDSAGKHNSCYCFAFLWVSFTFLKAEGHLQFRNPIPYSQGNFVSFFTSSQELDRLFICEQYQCSNTKLGGFVLSINLFICCAGTSSYCSKRFPRRLAVLGQTLPCKQ